MSSTAQSIPLTADQDHGTSEKRAASTLFGASPRRLGAALHNARRHADLDLLEHSRGAMAPRCERLAARLTWILGTWKLVSWTIEDLATGETQNALGADPNGYITYTADGRMIVLFLKRDRACPTELVPNSAEKIGLYDSMLAYAGRFSIDDEKVVHHVDMSWNQGWTGTDQIRYHAHRGDVLILTGAPARSPLNGRDCVHTVTFHRSH
jgi:hypothetical protein